MSLTICQHTFHLHCLIKWASNKIADLRHNPEPYCPLCKKHLVTGKQIEDEVHPEEDTGALRNRNRMQNFADTIVDN